MKKRKRATLGVDGQSAMEDAPRRANLISADENSEDRHFSFFWCRGRWAPEVAQRIAAWGDALSALAALMSREAQERDVAERPVEALFALLRESADFVWRRSQFAVSEGNAREAAVQDIFLAAGLSESFLESIALELLELGWADLAFDVLSIEEFLLPSDAGPSRYHLLALTGRPEQGHAGLTRIISGYGSTSRREHAQACLRELELRRGADGNEPP